MLHVPDEDHWIPDPGKARILRCTVFASSHHVIGDPQKGPTLR